MYRCKQLPGLAVLLFAATPAQATNGYFTDGIGAKNQGRAGAGSADPEGLVIIATNPAGLASIDERLEVEVQRDRLSSGGDHGAPDGSSSCSATSSSRLCIVLSHLKWA